MSLLLFTGEIKPDARYHFDGPGCNPIFDEKRFYAGRFDGAASASAFDIIAELLMSIKDGDAIVSRTDRRLFIAGSEQKHGSVWLEITPDGKLTLGEPGV